MNMNRSFRRFGGQVPWLILPLVLTAMVLWVMGQTSSTRAQGNQVAKDQLTFKQALNLAKKEAKAWNRDAALYQAISVDVVDVMDPTQGIDGRRARWNFDYVVPGTERHYQVLVDQGKVVLAREFRNPVTWDPLEEQALELDSVDLVKEARKQGLRSARNLAFGYHFRYLRREGVPTVVVYGEDEVSGRNKALEMDPKRGKVR